MLTQKRVDDLHDALIANATLVQKGFNTGYRIFNSGFYHTGFVLKAEPLIMLASTSKVLIALETAIALVDEVQTEIPLTPNMLVEAIERDPQVVGRPAYKHLGKAVTQAKIIAGAKKLPGGGRIVSGVAQQLEGQLQNVTVPITEVFYQSLTLSSNSATQAIAKFRGRDINPTALANVYSHLSASYSMLVSTESNHHWTEYAPNVGKISEIGVLLYGLARGYVTKTANPLEVILAQSLINNKQDFGHCFTRSDKGQELISRKYVILEKTGYYPAVTWIEALARNGYPTICTVSSVFSIVSPSGIVDTFCAFINAEVAYPWERIEEDGIVFPNEWGESYKRYIAGVKAELNIQLRQMMLSGITPFIG